MLELEILPIRQVYLFPCQTDNDYRTLPADSRLGVNLTSDEAAQMGKNMSALLKQGLSPYEILQIHPERGICEKALSSCIVNDVFRETNGMEFKKEVTHLSSEERRIIETGNGHESAETAIGEIIDKNHFTLGNEINLHRKLKHKSFLSPECPNCKHCRYGRECFPEREDFERFI